MVGGVRRRRRRARAWAVVALAATVAVSAALLAPAAVAGPVADAEPVAAELVVERIAQLDAMLQLTAAALPDAESQATSATVALDAARAEEQRVLAAAPPAVPGGSDTLVDTAASAILGDLGPERATQTRISTEQVAFVAGQRRDELHAASTAAWTERAALLASLDEHGQARTRWSIGLLDALGAPVTHENIRGLSAWIGAEAHNASARNPLATTMGAPGATVVNDHGVRAYPSDLIGIDATVRTLRNGRYGDIVFALAAGDSAPRLVAAVAASPWGTGDNAVLRLQLDSR